MRRYRKISAANSGWPPLFFNEKPISHKKSAGNIFLILMQKKAYSIGKPGFPKRKTKDVTMFFGFEMEAIVHRNLCLEKSVKKVEKSNFKQKKHSVPSSSTLFMEDNIVRQLDSRFLSFWLASWGGPILTTFAINVERQRRKIYRRNFDRIVEIWSPPLFF